MNNGFDKNKRRTLKLIAGGAASPLVVGMSPAIAAMQSVTALTGSDLIDCVLVSRADGSRIHLLMHNKTNTEVVANTMESQFVVFGGTAINMAEAYTKPVVIPPNDRVMVRLNIEAGMQGLPITGDVLDLNIETQYLPKGARQVLLKVRMINGVGQIENNVVLA